MRTAAFVCAIGLAILPRAFAQRDETASRLSQAIDAIDRAMAASTRPATVIGITDRTRTLNVFAHGYTDLKARTPITADSLFGIGSISKSFTAIALLELFDEGRFDPRAPITTYLPWFAIKSAFAPITGHHLLTHTAGLPNYRPDVASMVSATYELRDFEPSYAPGEHYWYSNIGYQTLGYALERIDRAAYPAIIQRRIFDRLGMRSSAAEIDDRLRTKLAVSYSLWPYSNEYVEQPWFEYRAADGSIVSTAADLAAYARLILNRGAGPGDRLLSERAFSMLTTPALNNYAYGLTVRQADGDTLIGHSGAIAGFQSLLEVHMNDGFALIALSSVGSDPPLVQWIANTLKAVYRNTPLPEYPRPPAQPASDWAGVFKNAAGKTLEFVVANDRLAFRRGGSVVPLTRIGRDSFREAAGDAIPLPFVFERQDDRVVEVSQGSDSYFTAAYAGPNAFNVPPEYASYVGRYENHNPEGQFVRIFIRNGRLVFANGPTDGGRSLVHVAPHLFRPAEPEYNPERYRFDSFVEGRALRLVVSGMPMYRVDAQ